MAIQEVRQRGPDEERMNHGAPAATTARVGVVGVEDAQVGEVLRERPSSSRRCRGRRP